jgi:hypothetical protein
VGPVRIHPDHRVAARLSAELIGYPPAQTHVFDVEATVEGRYDVARLAKRGLAFGD